MPFVNKEILKELALYPLGDWASQLVALSVSGLVNVEIGARALTSYSDYTIGTL